MSIVLVGRGKVRSVRRWCISHPDTTNVPSFDKLSKRKRQTFHRACRGIGRYLKKTKGATR